MKKELTNTSKGRYSESLKTAITAFAPRQSVFFMPMAWMRAENNQYQPKLLIAAFSESTPLLILNGDFLKKAIKMTNTIISKINEIRSILDDVYANTSSQPLALESSAVRKELADLIIEILDQEYSAAE